MLKNIHIIVIWFLAPLAFLGAGILISKYSNNRQGIELNNQEIKVIKQESVCNYADKPIDKCEFTANAIGVYTFELIIKYGSFGEGAQPNDLFESSLRIVKGEEVVFSLTGERFSLKNNNGEAVFIETAVDFKKTITNPGSSEPTVEFQLWPGGNGFSSILYKLELGDSGLKIVNDTLL